VRFGLIGCGHMGKFHASKLGMIPTAEFIGCHDIVSDKANEIAEQYGCEVYNSIDDFFGKIDAVIIAVPTKHHHDVAIRMLQKKIAVLLEKPIAPEIESANDIVRAAEKNNVILQIGHSERFNPVYRAARGRIENPRFIETHRLAPFKGRGHDVAVILDLMIHDIDLLLDLTGSEPSIIEAAGVGVITETFDIVNARLTFPTGCVANITASRISLKEMRKLRVFQRSGYISMDLAKAELEAYSIEPDDSFKAREAGLFSKFALPDGQVIVRESSDIPRTDNLQSEIESFIEAIEGKHPPVVSGRDGLTALKVARQIEDICIEYQSTL
jgi:predicted dehydrogenase